MLMDAGIEVDEDLDEVLEVVVTFLLARSRFAALGMHVVIVAEDTS